MKNQEPSWLDYFSGGVPTGEFFRMTLSDVHNAIDKSSKGLSRVNEICYIGLVSYFEAFCKDHFASILNIEPTLIFALQASGQDTHIDPARLLEFQEEWRIRLGFLVAEKYDFGTAKKINSLYASLLKVSPFSKDEKKYYDSILRDRNLLVHHGGTYTTHYLAQNKPIRPFMDSSVVTPSYLKERIDYISVIARKMLKATHAALVNYISAMGTKYTDERNKVVDAFLWWGDDEKNYI